MCNGNSNDDEQVAAASLLELLCSGKTDTRIRDDSSDSESFESSKTHHGTPAPRKKDTSEQEQKSLLLSTSHEISSIEALTSEDETQTQTQMQMQMIQRSSQPITDNKVSPIPKKKTASGRTKKFPEALMELLTNDKHQDLMCFLPDDKNFIIANSKKFSEEVMPKYFKMSKFGCFLNRLTKFGFTHAALDNDQYIFFHPLFHRSDWVSLQHIEYKPIKVEIGAEKKPTDFTRKRKLDYSDVKVSYANPVSKVLCLKETNLSPFHSFLSQEDMSHEIQKSCHISTDCRRNHSFSLSPPTNLSLEDSHGSLLSSIISSSREMSASDLIETATKDVVTKAIDCLLYDESHTLDLLARRGQEVHCRRLSLPL